jgi:riboflavin biosynthesis pyrimidine reductase
MGHLFEPQIARNEAALNGRRQASPAIGIAQGTTACGSASRPFVHVNFALDSTGRTTQGQRCATPLSCPEDWQRVHKLRERYSAVVVGARTWQIDKPQLTARAQHLNRQPRRQPDRVIFAGRSACDVVPDERRTFVVGLQPQPPGIIRITALEHDLEAPLAALQRYGVESLLVEGGLTLLSSFIQKGMVDRVSVYVATDDAQGAVKALQHALPALSEHSFHADRFGAGILLTFGEDYTA